MASQQVNGAPFAVVSFGMAERFVDDFTRELIEAIDARLYEAQRLRSRLERRWRKAPFWPDRRGIGRASDEYPHDEESPAA